MRIDVPVSDAWSALCDQYRAVLPFQEPALQVQVYLGFQHGLLEITQGLARLFSHKKTVAIASSEPSFESIAVGFSQEGYTVKSLTAADLEEPSTWFDAIQGDLLFVLFGHDDPVTGQVFQYQKLNDALKDKRIFRIAVSHAAHRFQAQTRPMPFEVRILSLQPERALVIAGERCRVTPQLATRLPWKRENQGEIQAHLAPFNEQEHERMKSEVIAFEKSLPAGFKPYFQGESARLYDRTLFFHPELDGAAVVEELAAALGETLQAPGEESTLETTSPCRWESLRFAGWLLTTGKAEEVVRGLVVASHTLIGKGLREKLEAASSKILKAQRGE